MKKKDVLGKVRGNKGQSRRWCAPQRRGDKKGGDSGAGPAPLADAQGWAGLTGGHTRGLCKGGEARLLGRCQLYVAETPKGLRKHSWAREHSCSRIVSVLPEQPWMGHALDHIENSILWSKLLHLKNVLTMTQGPYIILISTICPVFII